MEGKENEDTGNFRRNGTDGDCLFYGTDNRNDSGRKLITRENVTQVSVKGKYIYYTESKYSWESRKCRCDLNGNNKKALTKWSGGLAR